MCKAKALLSILAFAGLFTQLEGQDYWWVKYNEGAANGGKFRGICALSATNVWVVGEGGKVCHQEGTLHSPDWVSKLSGYGLYDFNDVCFVDADHGWIVGEKRQTGNHLTDYSGVVLYTESGGTSWSDQTANINPPLPHPTPFLKVKMVWKQSTQHYVGYIACGNGIVLSTEDDGLTWLRTQADPWSDSVNVSNWYNGLWVNPNNAQEVWVAGDAFSVLSKTTDGGNSWDGHEVEEFEWNYTFPPPPAPGYLVDPKLATFDVDFNSLASGSVALSHGRVGSTANGGATWTVTSREPIDTWFSDINNNTTCGNFGIINCSNTQECVNYMWKGDGDPTDFKCIADNSCYAAGEGSANIRQRYCPVVIGGTTTEVTWHPYPDDKYTIDISIQVLHAENVSGYYCTPYAYNHMDRLLYLNFRTQPVWTFELRKNSAYGGISYFFEISVVTNEGWKKEITTIEVTAGELTELTIPYVRPVALEGIEAHDYPDDNGHKIELDLSVNQPGNYWIGRQSGGGSYNYVIEATFSGIYLDPHVQDQVSYGYCAAQIVSDNTIGFYKTSDFVYSDEVQSINNNAPGSVTGGAGIYDLNTETINLWWSQLSDGDIAGYWVCPIFPDEPPRSLIIHAAPIDRTSFRAPLPYNEYQGELVIYYIAAIDYAGIIGPWSDPINIFVGSYITLSTSAEATAFNNGRNFMRIPDTDELWLTYPSDGYIYAAYSTDEGATWTKNQLGRGSFPAISYNPDAETPRPSVVWQSEDAGIHYLYFSRYLGNDSWTKAQVVQTGAGGTTFGPPSFAIGVCDTGHIAYAATTLDFSTIKYAKFNLFNPASSPSQNVGTGQCPSIAYMNSTGKPPIHVAWEYNSMIKYRNRTSAGWGPTETPSGFLPSYQPMLEAIGNNAYVAWAENTQYGDIYWRCKVYTGPFGNWMAVKQVNSTPQSASTYPVLTGGYSCAWVEQNDAGFEVYYSSFDDLTDSWSIPVNISTHASEEIFSNYPHIAHKQTMEQKAKIYFIWTEGAGPNVYPIKYKTYDIGEGKNRTAGVLPFYVAYGGDEKASPFNLKRDGYSQYGYEPHKKIDWANAFLEYRFETLDQDRLYDLTAYLYQHGTTNLKLFAAIDSSMIGSILLPPDTLIQFNHLIPSTLYADNSISLKIAGDKNQAVSAILTLHEFEKGKAKGRGQGIANGPQGIDSKPLSAYPLSLIVQPSHVARSLSIRYSIPQKGQVKVSLYDISGRLVRNLVDDSRKPGAYTLNCDIGDLGLSCGVYFLQLETGNRMLVQKAVVVK